METTTLRVGEPRELLALIPFQLGFAPRDSAVVVSLRSPRRRVGLVARVDLADLTDATDGPQVARSLVTHLVSDGARSAVVVVYTDDDLQSRDQDEVAPRGTAVDPPHGVLAAYALREAGEYFLGEMECWVVGPRGFYNLECLDRACCPPGGRPLHELQSTAVGAEMVLRGATVAPSRADVGRIEMAPAAARRSARRSGSRWAARARAAVESSELYRWRLEGLQLWRHELDAARRGSETWTVPGTTALGRLQAALEDVLVRDAVLLSVLPGPARVGERILVGDAGEEVGEALRALTDPSDGTPPEEDVNRAARLVLEQVVAHGVRRGHGPALTLLGVLAWWEGDGARAGVLVERALAASPGYRLALLLDEALSAGMPPGWLRPGREEPAGGPGGL
ncbi:DUF4192 domain-containing protein [Actinotalea sp. K2]|uniref:DUF4192 domain-containing protein n=1 Tax=Actinotalea sp. K2 TaxID=2939438 RepID=UPI0020174EB2|nr:DUF4192 domain-containing protein [Actinotalea sp. K2]MCL3862181.1 DUF4192 domain-containing protein [Actinotalea sp. K2]